VGIHAAGGHKAAVCIDDLATIRGGNVGSYGKDLAVITDEDTAVGDVGTDHGFDVTIFDQKHKIALL
jgi:hypothetical protein